MTPFKSIKDLSFRELAAEMASWGEPEYRARQVYSWLFRRGGKGFQEMSDLNKDLRRRLEGAFLFVEPEEAARQTSADGTVKFALRLADGELIESVIITDGRRRTLCVSTQAGCGRGCRICATAAMGFRRNLTSGEILNQVIHANRLLEPGCAVSHIVFMGMGEPMDNLDEVLRALHVIHDDYGFCISPHRVTVSTVGVLEGIRRLALEGKGEGLAISLHASNDRVRQKLVPLARKVPIGLLVGAASEYARKFKDKVTFEYVMISGLNCLPGHGREIVGLLARIPCKLNLIPCNPARDPSFQPPGEEEIKAFLEPVLRTSIIVTRRKPKGGDIAAACGQLASKT